MHTDGGDERAQSSILYSAGACQDRKDRQVQEFGNAGRSSHHDANASAHDFPASFRSTPMHDQRELTSARRTHLRSKDRVSVRLTRVLIERVRFELNHRQDAEQHELDVELQAKQARRRGLGLEWVCCVSKSRRRRGGGRAGPSGTTPKG